MVCVGLSVHGWLGGWSVIVCVCVCACVECGGGVEWMGYNVRLYQVSFSHGFHSLEGVNELWEVREERQYLLKKPHGV